MKQSIFCLQLQCNSSNRYKKQDVEFFFCCKLKSKLEDTKSLQVGATQNPTLICTTGVKKESVQYCVSVQETSTCYQLRYWQGQLPYCTGTHLLLQSPTTAYDQWLLYHTRYYSNCSSYILIPVHTCTYKYNYCTFYLYLYPQVLLSMGIYLAFYITITTVKINFDASSKNSTCTLYTDTDRYHQQYQVRK